MPLTEAERECDLGVHEFTLFARIQADDVAVTRLASGIMAINPLPRGEGTIGARF